MVVDFLLKDTRYILTEMDMMCNLYNWLGHLMDCFKIQSKRDGIYEIKFGKSKIRRKPDLQSPLHTLEAKLGKELDTKDIWKTIMIPLSNGLRDSRRI